MGLHLAYSAGAVTGPVLLRMRISVKEPALSPVLCPATPAALPYSSSYSRPWRRSAKQTQTVDRQSGAGAFGRPAATSDGEPQTLAALLHERTRLAVAVYSALVAHCHYCHPCPARLIAR
jgi:hypothetical protein